MLNLSVATAYLTVALSMMRQRFRSLTNPLAEMWHRRRSPVTALAPMRGGSDDAPDDLITHYRNKLGAEILKAQELSDKASEYLKDGKTLDDPDVKAVTEARATAHDNIEQYQRALDSEVAISKRREDAHTALQSAPQQVWVAPVAHGDNNGGSGGKGDSSPKPFQSFGQELAAIATYAQTQTPDPRLQALQTYALGLGEGIPSEGGFLVQTDFSDELLKRIHEVGKIFSAPRHIPVGERSNGLKINAIDETSRVDGSRLGGVQAYWVAEAGTLTKSKPTFRQIELSLKKIAALYYATDEELTDTVALEATTAAFFAEEIAFKLDDALIRGSGAGDPLGILGHAGTVDVAKEAGQAADTVIVENIEAMYSRMWARSIQSATWYINQDVWPQLFALEKAVGTGGVPVFLPAGGLSAAPFGSLMGLPIVPIEQCESVGTSGDIILADFASGYIVIDKGGIQAASSMHVQFLTDEMVFRFTLRTDGQPIANATLTPYKGTLTQSAFVTLADRD